MNPTSPIIVSQQRQIEHKRTPVLGEEKKPERRGRTPGVNPRAETQV
jgi:hypothetical protein